MKKKRKSVAKQIEALHLPLDTNGPLVTLSQDQSSIYKTLVDMAGDGIILLDPQGNILLANKRTEQIGGYSREEIIGCNYAQFLCPESVENMTADLKILLKGGILSDRQVEIRSKRGEKVSLEVSASSIRQDDEIVGFLAIVRDITRRKEVEQEILRQSSLFERQAEEMTSLYNIGVAVASSLDPDEVLNQIYEQVHRLKKVSTFFIALYDKEENRLDFEIFVDKGEHLPKFSRHITPGKGLTEWVVQRGQPLLIRDLQDQQTVPTEWITVGEPTRSWLGIPLMAKGKVIGAMSVQSYETNAFDQDDQQFFQAVANQAVLAIENARLYSAELQRSRESLALLDVAATVSSTLDLTQVLKRIARRTAEICNANRCSIFLLDKEGRKVLPLMSQFASGKADKRLWRIFKESYAEAVDDVPPFKQVIKERKPAIINDVTPADLPARWIEPFDIKSLALVPLTSRDRAIGLMALDYVQEGQHFTKEQVNRASTIGSQVAITIENARLFAEKERRISELASLNQIGRTLSSSLDLDQVLTFFMNSVNELFRVEAGSLLLIEGDELKFRVALGEKGDLVKPFSLKLGQGIAGVAAQEGKSLLVSDVSTDERYYPAIDAATGFVTKSILAVPMKLKEKVIGTIEVINPLKGEVFTEGDKELLEAIAASAAIAIDNARLHQETEHRLAEASTLYTLAKQLATSLDLNTIMETVVTLLRRVISCRGCCIFLLDEESQMLKIEAASGLKPKWREAARLKVGQGVAGRVVKEDHPLYIPDLRQEEDAIFFDPSVRSLLAVPLISRDKVIGALCIDDDTVDAFQASEGRLLTIVASQAAAAIENAQLYRGLQERAQELQRAYEELKELNRLKSEFVQNVSHELRTPLTYIKSYIELILEDREEPLPESYRDSLRIVAQKTDTTIRLVNDIISLQKTSMATLDIAPLSLSEIAQSCVQGVSTIAAEAGIELKTDIPPHLPLIPADHDQVEQVLNNLLDNAIKFSPNGGTITVRIRDEGDHLLTKITDTGIGIPADKLERVFERFYQVDGSTKRRFGGTGLGLAIVKRIVEAHGGNIWVESRLEEGSTFYFTLPKEAG